MDRRGFLTALTGAITTACVGGAEVSTGSTFGSPSSTTLATTTTARPVVEPLEPPLVELPPGVFGLGVASGDPDSSSVVLWTRLLPIAGAPLPSAVQLLWEMAYDEAFTQLAATGVTDVGVGFAHTAHVVVNDLPAATQFHYRFRVGAQSSPAGRTRTMAGPAADVERLRVGVSSCQLMETGNWAAHRDMAEADLDLVIWLGDFIYGGGGFSQLEGRAHQGSDPVGLAGYRNRYEQYRADPALQAASAAHPWVATWDDHEVVNNYDATVDPDRRAAAYQAWWEHLPTRLPAPALSGFDVYRSIDAGNLCRISLLDARQYADGTTLLGETQQQWLAGELDHQSTWTLLGSPLLVGGILVPLQDELLLPYTFDGYPDERAWLADRLAAKKNRICVSGDLHSSAVLEVSADPADPKLPVVATEFMAPAISSQFPEDFAALVPFIPLANAHIHHVDVANGWLQLDFEPTRVTAEFRHVSDVANTNSPVTTASRWQVLAGDPTPSEI